MASIRIVKRKHLILYQQAIYLGVAADLFNEQGAHALIRIPSRKN